MAYQALHVIRMQANYWEPLDYNPLQGRNYEGMCVPTYPLQVNYYSLAYSSGVSLVFFVLFYWI